MKGTAGVADEPLSEANPGAATRHVLLTALGKSGRDAAYRLDDRSATAKLAPLAILDLTGAAVDLVVAVCTQEAAQSTLPVLQEGLCRLARPIGHRVVRVPEATTAPELAAFVETVATEVARCCGDANVRLWVDLTHGLRHHAVLLYATALYLDSLERVEVEHVWYAPLTEDPAGAEVLDLQPLLLLPQLVHAVRELREAGSARSLAGLVAYAPKQGSDAQRALAAFTRAVVAGLPLEAGIEADALLRAGAHSSDPPQKARQLRTALTSRSAPLAGELADEIARLLKPLALEPRDKTAVVLDRDELRRQAALVDRLIDWGMLHTAVGLMREWVVSWAIWAGRPDGVPGPVWLERKNRAPAERLLNALRIYADDVHLRPLLGPERESVARFWAHLGDLRNAYMHFGMQAQYVDPLKAIAGSNLHTKWKKVQRQWRALTSGLPRIDLAVPGGAGRVLVSPLGLSPGVLCNAIHAARDTGREPGHVVVICSPESEGLVAEAVARASWEGQVVSRSLDDPFGAVGAMRPREGRQLPDDPNLRRLLAAADEVLVNLTGGTTAMAVVAQQLADAARAFERPVRRFALIDRRTPDEQRQDPWAPAEAVFLDDGGVTPEA